MRVAEISAFSQYSVGKIMRDIKYYVDEQKNGDVCEVFYARGKKSHELGFNRYANRAEVLCNAFFSRIFDNDGFGLRAPTKRLIKQLKRFQPDVVHIHCLHGYHINVKTLFDYFKNSKVKVVWTMHDAWAFTGHCCFFSMAGCNRWKTQCFSCPQKKSYPTSKLFDCSKRNFRKKKEIFTSLPKEQLTIVTPSDWLSELTRKSFLGKYDVHTVHNGINTDIFNRIPSKYVVDLPKDKKILLGVASVWDKRKGLDTFLDLSKELDEDWQIVLIGRLEKNVKLPSSIIYVERTENQEALKAYYQHCNVFLNPTRDDNYPTVNLEAQACGAKVLTFDTGGCKETDCGNLRLVDEKNLLSYLNREDGFLKNQTILLEPTCSFKVMCKMYYDILMGERNED